MSVQSIQSTFVELGGDGSGEIDDDGHLRSCPACGEEWPEWDPRDGQNPLVDHLHEYHWPSDFGLSQMRGGRQR